MANPTVADTLKQEEFPLSIYFFREDGKYDKRDVVQVHNIPQLKVAMIELVAPHFRKGLEVRITDSGDTCLFQCDKGKIIFPKETVNGAAVDEDRDQQPEQNSQQHDGSDGQTGGSSVSNRKRMVSY